MAWTTDVARATETKGFIKNCCAADLSSCEEIHAAVAGKRIVLDRVSINSAATLTVTIGEGETTNNVTTAIIGPVSLVAGATAVFEFARPLVLTAATSLTADASGSGVVCIVAEGRVI